MASGHRLVRVGAGDFGKGQKAMLDYGRALRTAALAAAAALTGTCAMAAQDLASATISGAAAERALTRDEISLATARAIADHCFNEAAGRGMGVSIFILSPAGDIVYSLRADGQGPVNIQTALMKAKTALFMRDSTHAWMNRMQQNMDFQVRLIPLNQFWNSGGLPIVVDNVLIGAIGAGGMAPSAEWSDEICIHNAMTAVLGPQPPLAPFEQ
jgi:glc operon protein GlcG